MAAPQRGIVAEHDLRGLAVGTVQLVYRGVAVPPDMGSVEIECEVYEADGVLSVHTVCPRCRRTQWIDGRNKKIEFSGLDRLFVESFLCPWELGDDRRQFGVGLCRLRLVYDGREARDA